MVSSTLKFGILAALLFVATADADEADPLFASFETIDVTLEAPFRSLMRERDEDNELAGKLRYVDGDGETIELDVKVRTRGKFRASKDICEFAPLRLNFRTSQAAGTVFANQDKIKLVTHCDTRSTRYEQGLITEYLTYRLLNALTEFSYRARLLRIRYVYTDSKSRIDSFAFLIENDERLAKRLDQDLLSVPNLQVANLDREYTNLVSVYQYMATPTSRPSPARKNTTAATILRRTVRAGRRSSRYPTISTSVAWSMCRMLLRIPGFACARSGKDSTAGVA